MVATTAFVTASDVTERTATATLTNKTLTSPAINTPTITGGTITGITDLTVADGGTGASSITANSVILGNGSSTLSGNLVAPGTIGNVLTSNGTTWASTALPATITRATAQASTSGTSIDFTGIPSTAKRITVMFSGVGSNGTSYIVIRIGAGSYQTTGYDSVASASTTAGGYHSTTAGFYIYYPAYIATSSLSGIITLINITGNVWVQSGNVSDSVYGLVTASSSGFVTLSGALDRLRVTTVNGTDTFDAGTINILYE